MKKKPSKSIPLFLMFAERPIGVNGVCDDSRKKGVQSRNCQNLEFFGVKSYRERLLQPKAASQRQMEGASLRLGVARLAMPFPGSAIYYPHLLWRVSAKETSIPRLLSPKQGKGSGLRQVLSGIAAQNLQKRLFPAPLLQRPVAKRRGLAGAGGWAQRQLPHARQILA